MEKKISNFSYLCTRYYYFSNLKAVTRQKGYMKSNDHGIRDC